MTSFGLLIIGDEILSGKRADKHLPKVIELLGTRGLQLSYAEYVGDNPARLTAVLTRLFSGVRDHGDVVFSCGGIGATPDDHTRACAAAALGVDLVLHAGAAALITERMAELAQQQGQAFDAAASLHLHRLNMGVFPQGAALIPNPYNKIPGFSCRAGLGALHCVPGFPVMAWPMIEYLLDTEHAHLHQKEAYIEKSIIIEGSMEALLTPLMEHLEAGFPGVKVFSLPSVDHPLYGRHVELGLKGHPAKVEPAYTELRRGLEALNLQQGPELVRALNAPNQGN